jgi:hypothetical protein
LDCKAGQFLNRIKDLSVAANKVGEIAAFNHKGSALIFNTNLNITIKVGDIKEPF